MASGPKSLSLSPQEMSRSMCRVQGDLDVLFMLRKKTTGSQGKLLAIFLQKMQNEMLSSVGSSNL